MTLQRGSLDTASRHPHSTRHCLHRRTRLHPLPLPPPTGQGLPTQPSAEGAAAAAHARWRLHYARAAVWKAAYRRSPAAACNGAAAASPCYQASPKQGGPRAPADSEAVLSIATAPGYYSSLDPRSTGGVRVLGPPRDQRPCSTCAAFAAVAAAEAAVARATGRDAAAAGGGGLSVQDLHMCGPVPRTCYTSWSIKGALDALQARPLLLERCLPFSGAASEGKSPDALCARARRCSDRDAAAVLGGWEVAPLADAWQVQRHIRDWGAVVTRFEIYSDFRGFYEVRANARKAYSPRKGAAFQEGHAVALVGYSNAPDGGGFWIARCVGTRQRPAVPAPLGRLARRSTRMSTLPAVLSNASNMVHNPHPLYLPAVAPGSAAAQKLMGPRFRRWGQLPGERSR